MKTVAPLDAFKLSTGQAKIVLVVLAIASYSSFAAADCPILSGTYYCKRAQAENPDTVKVINQDKVGEFTRYTIDSKDSNGTESPAQYLTDGKMQVRIDPGNGRGKGTPVTESATCANGALVVKGSFPLPMKGMTLDFTSEFKLTDSRDLKIFTHSKIEGMGESDDPKDCERINPP